MELWTDISPTGAYWNPTRVLSDNRLAAFKKDISEYQFHAPQKGLVSIEVTLIYRRAFKELLDQKKWNVPDIVMAHTIIAVP
jgi:hypothetical protein